MLETDGSEAHMGTSRAQRGVCRVVGHRWAWRLEDDWPYHECRRCGSHWSPGRPLPGDVEDFTTSVLDLCRTRPVGAHEVCAEAGRRYPDMHATFVLRLAEHAVRELVGERRVRLVRGRRDAPEGERQAVADAGRALRRWSTWAPAADDAVWLEAVDAPPR